VAQTPILSDFESNALIQVAAKAARFGSVAVKRGSLLRKDISEEDRRKAEEEDRQERKEWEARRQEALDEFTAAMNERLARAYFAGADAAVDRADRNNFNARSITLYLVVLAVVAMPAIAMIIKLSPETFGSYIAPVTGIAGTVVGYWFGSLDRSGKHSGNAR
jgi:hypothetical protein